MKKYNSKQLKYSAKKAQDFCSSTMGKLLIMVVFIMLAPSLMEGFASCDFTAFYSLIGLGSAGSLTASMAVIGNIEQPSDIETAPNQIGFRLWLLANEQIDNTVAFPLPDANRDVATIPLKSGEYWHYFEGVKDSNKFTSTAEKGDVTSTFNKTHQIIVKSNEQSLNFIEQYQGKGFIVLFQECETDGKYILGSSCKPMYLTNFENKEDGDGKYIMLTFGNDHWRQQNNYVGTIATQAPVTVPQDATDLAIVSGNNDYILSDATQATVIATFSGVAAADVGRIITVTAPAANTFDNTIADNSAFVLKDAATWTAKPGSSITFEIFDVNTFAEVDRIQTA